MGEQLPTVGRIVHYRLSESDVQSIKFARSAAGGMYPQGNPVAPGDTYPAVVVRTFGGPNVNLQVLLDGPDSFWATSRPEGDGPGTWCWPPRS
jgi:hypothetical protein